MANKEILYPVYDEGELHVVISKGNQKLGNIPAFNLLPANQPLKLNNGTQLTNIKGTCGKHCANCMNDCYAVRYVKMHHNACVEAYAKNTVIMRNDPAKLRKEIKEYCEKNIVKYFRFHTSGEIESLDQLIVYCGICEDNPEVVFYIYTKAFDIFEKYLAKYDKFPSNLVINLSEWDGNLADVSPELIGMCNIYAYDDGTRCADMDELEHCPAVDQGGHETGITCAMCRRCMKKRNVTAVYAH